MSLFFLYQQESIETIDCLAVNIGQSQLLVPMPPSPKSFLIRPQSKEISYHHGLPGGFHDDTSISHLSTSAHYSAVARPLISALAPEYWCSIALVRATAIITAPS